MPVNTTTIGTSGRYGLSDAVRPMVLIGTSGRYDFLGKDETLIPDIFSDPDIHDYWMQYMIIEDEDGNSIYAKKPDIIVIRNTMHFRATFGQDEPSEDGVIIYGISVRTETVYGIIGERWILETPEDKDNIDELVIECSLTALF